LPFVLWSGAAVSSYDRVVTANVPGASLPVMLIVSDATAAVEWYTSGLGADVLWDLGGVAGLQLDQAPFFLHEEVPGKASERSPAEVALTTTRIEVFVDEPDVLIARAAAAGASDMEPLTDHQAPWGVHRQGGFTDPLGHRWSVGDRSPLARLLR
jgi:PhnB protein